MLDFSLSNSLSHCSRAHSANWADGADPAHRRFLTRKQVGFSCGGLPVPRACYRAVPRGSRQAGVSMPTKVSSAHSLWFIYSSGRALVELTAWNKSSHLTGEADCIPSYCRGFFSLTFHYGCVQTPMDRTWKWGSRTFYCFSHHYHFTSRLCWSHPERLRHRKVVPDTASLNCQSFSMAL